MKKSELAALQTPVEFSEYIYTDFSVYEFTMALEEDEYLIQIGLRKKKDSHKEDLLDYRNDMYQERIYLMNNKERDEFFELHKYDKTYQRTNDTI